MHLPYRPVSTDWTLCCPVIDSGESRLECHDYRVEILTSEMVMTFKFITSLVQACQCSNQILYNEVLKL